LQHGIAYIDPRSALSRIETDYLASYGIDVNKWHERIGNAHSRLVAIGSPRFDRCFNERSQALEKGKQLFQQLELDTKRPVLLAAVPEFYESVFWFNPYQFAEFFEAIHTVQNKIPGLQILFKCRNQRYVNVFKRYFKELFFTDSAVVGSEDLFALLSASDAVVCGNSTVLYEAVLTNKPLVLYPWKIFDTYNARIYERVIPLARKEEELVDVLAHIFTSTSYREELMLRQIEFLKNYSFDGKSSERAVALLRKLPQMKNLIRD
jgi:CDP-glycerol glycerophosphotransferase (TagB/SpsB family)